MQKSHKYFIVGRQTNYYIYIIYRNIIKKKVEIVKY